VKSFPHHFRISIPTCHHSAKSFRLSFSPAAGNPFFFFVFIAKLLLDRWEEMNESNQATRFNGLKPAAAAAAAAVMGFFFYFVCRRLINKICTGGTEWKREGVEYDDDDDDVALHISVYIYTGVVLAGLLVLLFP
jgi:hypothetical protein